jgi:hypothetical protein
MKTGDANVEEIARSVDQTLLEDMRHTLFVLPLKPRKLSHRRVKELPCSVSPRGCLQVRYLSGSLHQQRHLEALKEVAMKETKSVSLREAEATRRGRSRRCSSDRSGRETAVVVCADNVLAARTMSSPTILMYRWTPREAARFRDYCCSTGVR